jgi:proteic killer suppression protein
LDIIKSFHHKGIQQFFETVSKTSISSEYEAKLARQLLLLNAARSPLEMDLAG